MPTVRETTGSAPNIILILTDQHRYDINGFAGNPLCRTPHLDTLAASGVSFTNAYSHCPLCTPTRASLYSGRAIHNHGIFRNIESTMPNAPSIGTDELPSLAQHLEKAGYRSAFIGKWHAGKTLPGECGFDAMDVDGYGDIVNAPCYADYLKERNLERPEVTPVGVAYPHNLLLAGRMSGPVQASVPYFLAEKTIEKIADYAESEQPFFVALNFWGPHAPYLPCEPYASMYNPDDIPQWANFADTYDGRPPIYRRHHDAVVGEGQPTRSWEECAKWAALYFGFMTQIDEQIGRVLDSLKKLGVDKNTAILFSTDHGDLCGSHGGMHDKNAMMVQELMHIPMLARIPGMASQGTEIPRTVSNLDLPATITDLAGLGVPDAFDGKSLVPFISDAEAPGPDYVVSECFGVHFAYETRMVVHDRWKYVFHPGAFDELYDLKSDPAELKNLIDSDQDDHVAGRHACRQRLLEWMRDTRDPFHRAIFLFEEHDPYDPKNVTPYGNPQEAARVLLERPIRLRV